MSEWTRREVLEGAGVLAALPALLVACGRGGGLPVDPPPALLAKGLTGLVWNRFCATLESAAEHLAHEAAPRADSDVAEGYRMLTRLLGLALEMVVEGSDADRPAFFELQSAIRKYAGDNPDQRYAAAVIAGDRRYRIHGQRGNAELVEVGVYAGSFSGGGQRRLVANLTEQELAFAPDGSIELELAPDADPSRPNQIRLAPDAINVLVRQYYADPHDKRGAWRIERVPRAEPRRRSPPTGSAGGSSAPRSSWSATSGPGSNSWPSAHAARTTGWYRSPTRATSRRRRASATSRATGGSRRMRRSCSSSSPRPSRTGASSS